ncbi:MAG TPA: hypothetical protein VFU47_07055 [Armatimonadota bacterium]|nr:hypothetical protein [Armatimonadota bacterium]
MAEPLTPDEIRALRERLEADPNGPPVDRQTVLRLFHALPGLPGPGGEPRVPLLCQEDEDTEELRRRLAQQ